MPGRGLRLRACKQVREAAYFGRGAAVKHTDRPRRPPPLSPEDDRGRFMPMESSFASRALRLRHVGQTQQHEAQRACVTRGKSGRGIDQQ